MVYFNVFLFTFFFLSCAKERLDNTCDHFPVATCFQILLHFATYI